MQPDLAISVDDAFKTYRLYRRPIEQFLDALGLRRIIPSASKVPEFHAVRGISLDVARGSRIGILGRNGAGKTTFLKLLTGALRPTRGHVQVNGSIVALLEVGVGFHPDFTGYENIRSAISYNGLPDSEVDSAIEDIVEFCELGPFLHQALKTYSLGMKSRLYFACATAVRPDILIIDEVLGAGDSYFALRSQERMKALAAKGSTLLLVSHAVDQILRFCDEAIWIEGGQIVKRGPALSVVKDYDAFIRALDEQHKREIPGGATALENEWMRQHLVTTILEGSRPAEDEAATAEAPAASPVGEPEQPERSLPSPPTEIVAEGGVSRWPGAKGVKIDHVELLNRSEPTSQLHTGERLDVRLTIRHEVSRRFVCRYSVLIFTKDARAVSRFHSPAHEFQASEGAAHVVTLRLDPLLLSNGEYLVTVGIYGAGPLDQVAEAERYDNLSLSFKFRVVDPIRTEWSIFHHPCRWELPRLGEGTSEWHDVPHGAP